jgi:hypothetical protein
MPIAVALGLRAGAAGSHFQATKRHVDSTTGAASGAGDPPHLSEGDFLPASPGASAGWAFPVNVARNIPTSGWLVQKSGAKFSEADFWLKWSTPAIDGSSESCDHKVEQATVL